MGRLSPRRAWLPLQETFVPRRAWLPLTMELSPQATEGENSQPAPSAHPASQQARPISPSVKPFGLATSLVRGRQDGGRKQKTPAEIGGSHGRGRRIRTLGTRFWRPLLYQLSYTPKSLEVSPLAKPYGGPSGTRTQDRSVMSRLL